MKGRLWILMMVLVLPHAVSQEIGPFQAESRATFYHGVVNAGPLNVRHEPSLSGQVAGQLEQGTEVVVTGISPHPELIAGHMGHWLRVRHNQAGGMSLHDLGWVFSKYIDDLTNLRPDPIVIEDIWRRAGGTADLTVSGDRGGAGPFYLVHATRLGEQNFYTFTWNMEQRGFRYSNVPGTYVLFPETETIEHVSYHGHSFGTGRVYLTDDRLYQIQESGSSRSGIHEVVVRRVADGSSVYIGHYYGPLDVVGHQMTVCELYQVVGGVPHFTVLQDASTAIRRLFLTTPVEEWPDQTEVEVVVRYSLDFDTGLTTVVDALFLPLW